MTSFNIQFDKQDKKYRAGEIIRCVVQVQVADKFKARSLSLQFLGKAHTEWQRPGKIRRKKIKTFTADEQYFNQYHYLVGKKNGKVKEVKVGSYQYEQTFQLPANIPSSFEHANGYIKYVVKASYDIPDVPYKEYEEAFFVQSVLNLNEQKALQQPVKDFSHTRYGWWCCKRRDCLNVVNILPRRGWTPGETVPVSVQIQNHSNIKIDKVRLELVERVCFMTKKPHQERRVEYNTLKENFFSSVVDPLQKRQLETDVYLFPKHSWKLFSGCSIISCEYYLKTKVKLHGCLNRNILNTTLINVATVPLTDKKKGPAPMPPVRISTLINSSMPVSVSGEFLPPYHEAISPVINRSVLESPTKTSCSSSAGPATLTTIEPIKYIDE